VGSKEGRVDVPPECAELDKVLSTDTKVAKQLCAVVVDICSKLDDIRRLDDFLEVSKFRRVLIVR